MFLNEKSDSSPGVSLEDLLFLLEPTSIKTKLEGSTLVARHKQYTIRTEAMPPEVRESENGPIRAVIRMTTDMPKQLAAALLAEPESTAIWNAHAALGALSYDRGKAYIGSRLTVYEAEDTWNNLQLPLLMFTITCGSEAILGALRRSFTGEKPRKGFSNWTEKEFSQVESYLSRLCVCTTRGPGLTAEFGLAEGALSAAAGDHKTALIEMMADQPHPELGGGLLILLQMPHRLNNQTRLRQLCVQLNNIEMVAPDLPPHFGGWCEGKLRNNLAYVSFLPNPMYSVPGIALEVAIWAMNRARQINLLLESLGLHA